MQNPHQDFKNLFNRPIGRNLEAREKQELWDELESFYDRKSGESGLVNATNQWFSNNIPISEEAFIAQQDKYTEVTDVGGFAKRGDPNYGSEVAYKSWKRNQEKQRNQYRKNQKFTAQGFDSILSGKTN